MKEKQLENIRFEYHEETIKDDTREAAITVNLNMWFAPLVERFNNEGAIITMFLKPDGNNGLYLENISDILKRDAVIEFNKYIVNRGYQYIP